MSTRKFRVPSIPEDRPHSGFRSCLRKRSGLESRGDAIRVEYSFFRGAIGVQQRLPKLVGIVSSQLSTSAQEMLKAENHGAVAFFDIPPGSRRIRARHQLNQVVPVGDFPILCLPAPGNKSSVFQPCLDREIQAGSIGAALSARYDFSSILSTSSLHSSDSGGFRSMPLFGNLSEFLRTESHTGV